ncbi:MAG: hypothetical protein R3E39_14405 [Anaerolineae bacterium]
MNDTKPRAIRRSRQFYMPRGFHQLLDIVLVFVSFGIAYYMRYELQLIFPLNEVYRAPFAPYLPYAAVFATMIYLNYRTSGLYKSPRGRSYWDELYAVINGATNSTVVMLGLYFIFQPLVFSRLMALYVAVVSIVLLGRRGLCGAWRGLICGQKASACSARWSSARVT